MYGAVWQWRSWWGWGWQPVRMLPVRPSRNSQRRWKPAPGLAPEQAAAVLALADQVEDVLESSLNAFMGPPTPQQEGLEALEVLAALDPETVQPSVEGCAPMPEGADIDEEDGYPAMKETLTINCSFALPPFIFELTGGPGCCWTGTTRIRRGGFESMLNYRLTMTDEDGTVTATGKRDLQVSKVADGTGMPGVRRKRRHRWTMGHQADLHWDPERNIRERHAGIDSGTFVLAPTRSRGRTAWPPAGPA